MGKSVLDIGAWNGGWEFFRYGEVEGDTSNWLGPNTCALRAAIESAGFTIHHPHAWGQRAAMAAKKAQRQFLPDGDV